MSDVPKLTRLQVDAIRANTQRFLKQEGDSTTAMLPMLPKRLLIMCDTIDQLRATNEELVGLACDLAVKLRKELDRV